MLLSTNCTEACLRSMNVQTVHGQLPLGIEPTKAWKRDFRHEFRDEFGGTALGHTKPIF